MLAIIWCVIASFSDRGGWISSRVLAIIILWPLVVVVIAFKGLWEIATE